MILRLARATLAAVTLTAACGDVDVPPPPDVTPLVADYVEPTASLARPENARALRALATEELGQLEALGEIVVVPTVAAQLARDDAASEQLVGDGFLTVEIRCPGEGRLFGELPDRDEGRIVVTLTFTPDAIGSVVWGRFERCRFGKDLPRLAEDGRIVIEPASVEVDGAVRLFLGAGGLRFGRPPPEVLVDLTGDLALGPVRAEGVDLDFRLRPSGAIETRVDVDEGHLFLVVDDGGRLLGARAADGTWGCDFGGGICIDSQSGVTFRF